MKFRHWSYSLMMIPSLFWSHLIPLRSNILKSYSADLIEICFNFLYESFSMPRSYFNWAANVWSVNWFKFLILKSKNELHYLSDWVCQFCTYWRREIMLTWLKMCCYWIQYHYKTNKNNPNFIMAHSKEHLSLNSIFIKYFWINLAIELKLQW